jgi:aarF domain-containing kinase
VKAIDAVSREQLVQIAATLGIRNLTPVFGMVPVRATSLLPTITTEDKVILNNVEKVVKFLTAGTSNSNSTSDRVILHVYHFNCSFDRKIISYFCVHYLNLSLS